MSRLVGAAAAQSLAGGFARPAGLIAPFDNNVTIANYGGGRYRATKTSGADGWNTGAGGPVSTAFRFSASIAANLDFFAGVSADPAATGGFADMDIALYVSPTTIFLYASGVNQTPLGGYTVGDLLWFDLAGGTLTTRKSAAGGTFAGATDLWNGALAGAKGPDFCIFAAGTYSEIIFY